MAMDPSFSTGVQCIRMYQRCSEVKHAQDAIEPSMSRINIDFPTLDGL